MSVSAATGDSGRRAAPPRLPDCHPELTCSWHGKCSACGDTIHLATVDSSPGFGPLPDVELALFICGDPPFCADCRGAAEP